MRGLLPGSSFIRNEAERLVNRSRNDDLALLSRYHSSRFCSYARSSASLASEARRAISEEDWAIAEAGLGWFLWLWARSPHVGQGNPARRIEARFNSGATREG
jgi:hypothetical protein